MQFHRVIFGQLKVPSTAMRVLRDITGQKHRSDPASQMPTSQLLVYNDQRVCCQHNADNQYRKTLAKSSYDKFQRGKYTNLSGVSQCRGYFAIADRAMEI